MTIFLNIDAPPKPSDIELEALDQQVRARRRTAQLMTLPDFCDIGLHIHGRARQEFVDLDRKSVV